MNIYKTHCHITDSLFNYKFTVTQNDNITRNIKIEFMLTVFNNTYVSRFEHFHKEAIDYKIQRTKQNCCIYIFML